MLFDMRGVDFFRLQSSAGSTRITDLLSKDINFSGAADDGQCLFLQLAVSRAGMANGGNYTIQLGQTYATPPLVIGNLKLAEACVQNGDTLFVAGEIITPCMGRQNIYEKGLVRDYRFAFGVGTSSIDIAVAGFVGTAQFLVMEI